MPRAVVLLAVEDAKRRTEALFARLDAHLVFGATDAFERTLTELRAAHGPTYPLSETGPEIEELRQIGALVRGKLNAVGSPSTATPGRTTPKPATRPENETRLAAPRREPRE
ncbi:MAG: hypothetical protein H6720_16570 [Sandaracinus sp.]|nr:hypothetical protein [Sandaracinus sp.]